MQTRHEFVCLLLFVILCACSISLALKKEIAIADKSSKGSPVAISGVMLYSDEGPPQTPYSIQYRQTAKNIGTKPILLLVVGDRTMANEEESADQYSNDFFFSGGALDPNKSMDVSILGPNTGPPHEADYLPRFSPNAQVEYVEFVDGTHWGDPESARDAYASRNLTLDELHKLSDAYQRAGDEAFVAELSRDGNHDLPVISTLNHINNASDLEHTEMKAWEMLAAATVRLSAMGADKSNH